MKQPKFCGISLRLQRIDMTSSLRGCLRCFCFCILSPPLEGCRDEVATRRSNTIQKFVHFTWSGIMIYWLNMLCPDK